MAWEENKHPQDKSGQFTSKGNEGQGGKLELKSEKKKRISKYMNEDGTASFTLDEDPRSRSLLRNALGKDGVFLLKVEDGLYTVAPGIDTTNEQFENWLLENTGSDYKNKEELLDENDDDFDSDNDFESWNDDLSDEDIMQEIVDGDYYYGDLEEQEIYNLAAERLNTTPEHVEQALKKQGFDYEEYQMYIDGDDDFDKEDDGNQPQESKPMDYNEAKEYVKKKHGIDLDEETYNLIRGLK